MTVVSPNTRPGSVYTPYQTLPITGNRSNTVCSLQWIKNTAACLCMRPPQLAEENVIKANIINKLAEFFVCGKDILTLNNNQESVIDNFKTWISQHQGSFNYDDQRIVKDYCQELKAIISPKASEAQRTLLETKIGEIDKLADNIFTDIPIVVRNV